MNNLFIQFDDDELIPAMDCENCENFKIELKTIDNITSSISFFSSDGRKFTLYYGTDSNVKSDVLKNIRLKKLIRLKNAEISYE